MEPGGRTLELPWGRESIELSLPPDWELLGSMEPRGGTTIDLAAALPERLAHPTGCPPLVELARGRRKVALVIDDDSRPTPVAVLAPAVLAILQAAGIPRSAVVVVPATGLHRPMTDDEIAQRMGPEAFAGLGAAVHDPDDEESMRFLGTTRRGTPVWIAKAAAEADLVVGIGCIEPHIIAGTGGGAKILVPGVAGRRTIARNHSLNCRPATFNSVGRPAGESPMRLDLEEAAAMLPGALFVVNVVLDAGKRAVGLVAGDPVAAQREGAALATSVYGARIPALADIVIADSHPMDQDLRQGVKALANTIRALKPGGAMIVLVRAEEGLGVFGLAKARIPLTRGALRFLAPLLLPLVARARLPGLGEEDRFFLYFALQALRRGRLIIYAPTLPEAAKAGFPIADFPSTPAEAIAIARKFRPGRATVLVFPHGGATFPLPPA